MRIIFMGTPDFAVTTIEALYQAGHEIVLVVTQPDKPKGRGKSVQFPPVKEWAVEHELPVFQPVKIREAECIEELRKYQADIMVVAAFGQILPREILEMPQYGCVNVHASLLPKYRGASPIQWAVINGDEVSGVTTMQMGVGLDDGDMLLKEEVKLAADETGGSLFDRLAVVGGELIVRTLCELEQNNITPIPQKEEDATHVGMIKKQMGCIDFHKSATEIERLIRGMNPWPSAYTHYQGKTLKIWKAEVITDTELTQICDTVDAIESVRTEEADHVGHICYVNKTHVYVLCGEDILSLQEIQLEGKKRMKIEDFLRGHMMEEGEVLE